MEEKEYVRISSKKIIWALIIFILLVTIAVVAAIILNKKENTGIIDYKKEYSLTKSFEMFRNNDFSITLLASEGDNFFPYDFIDYKKIGMNLWLSNVCYNFENRSLEDYARANSYKGMTIHKENDGIIICHDGLEAEYNDHILIEDDNTFIDYNIAGNLEDYEENLQFALYVIRNAVVKNEAQYSEYVKVANEDSSYRAYDKLTESEQEKYDELYNQLFVKKEKYLTNSNPSARWLDIEYGNAFDALQEDMIYLNLEHYDLYINQVYIDGSQYGTDEYVADYYPNIYFPQRNNGTSAPKWIYENIEITEEEAKIFEQNVKSIIDNMPEGLSTYGKYRYLANSIDNITEYDFEMLEKAESIQEAFKKNEISYEEYDEKMPKRIYSMVGVFVDRKAVCTGYAAAYKYLCNKIGLYCEYNDEEYTNKDSNEEIEEDQLGHAYNYILLGGKIYFVDTTWLDGSFWNERAFAFSHEEALEDGHENYISEMNVFEKNAAGEKINELGKIKWNEIQYYIYSPNDNSYMENDI